MACVKSGAAYTYDLKSSYPELGQKPLSGISADSWLSPVYAILCSSIAVTCASLLLFCAPLCSVASRAVPVAASSSAAL